MVITELRSSVFLINWKLRYCLRNFLYLGLLGRAKCGSRLGMVKKGYFHTSDLLPIQFSLKTNFVKAINNLCNLYIYTYLIHSVHPTLPLSAGGLTLPPNFQKGWTWQGLFFQRRWPFSVGNFLHKNKLKSRIFNDKKGL